MRGEVEQQRLFLIPKDDVPEWFEVEGKGVAITTEPKYGQRVTMVISGIVDKVAVANDSRLMIPVVKFRFAADRSMVLDLTSVADIASKEFLKDLELFLTADDFGHSSPTDRVDPDTGEIQPRPGFWGRD